MDAHNRKVLEVSADLHQQVRKLALLNDLKIYVLANALVEDALNDKERIAALIKRLKL